MDGQNPQNDVQPMGLMKLAGVVVASVVGAWLLLKLVEMLVWSAAA